MFAGRFDFGLALRLLRVFVSQRESIFAVVLESLKYPQPHHQSNQSRSLGCTDEIWLNGHPPYSVLYDTLCIIV